ncbi:MAG: tyrosine-type recombinase/integrase [Syntrophaceae bacterium]
MKPTDFAYHLTNYLTKHLPGVVGASKNTVLAYRDTFSLILRFARSQEGIREEKLSLQALDKDFVIRFLAWLEGDRGCSASTRNQRLAAIHAFFAYLQPVIPDMLFQIQGVIAIPMKKHRQSAMQFMSEEGIKAVLAEPDISTKAGRKHLVILSFLFATGCRVQELVDMTVADAMYNSNTVARLTGKGNKSRFVPLDNGFVNLLKQYLDEFGLSDSKRSGDLLFANHTGQKLTRQGVTYILKKYAALARQKRPGLIPERISPHSMRHSRAVSLLRAGVDLIYIRDLLGHVSVQTTEIYARVDGEMKRKALEKAAGSIGCDQLPAWQKDKTLLEWLQSLG